MITHKKYYPVNKTCHNMILQPTLSFFYFKVNIPVIIKHLHSMDQITMISTYNFMCNDLKFKDVLLWHLKGQVFKCSEDI